MNSQPVQLELFPSEEDSVLYGRSPTYASLGDVGRRVVRAYLASLDATGKLPTQSDLASRSGLSRHAVSNQLGEKSSPAWQAITELLASCRDRLAVQSSIAIPALAWLILQQFYPGPKSLPRDTRTLTPTELRVLQSAAAMGGVAPMQVGDSVTLQVGATSGDGTAAASVTLQGAEGTLSDLVAKLRSSGAPHDFAALSTGAGHSAEVTSEVAPQLPAEAGGTASEVRDFAAPEDLRPADPMAGTAENFEKRAAAPGSLVAVAESAGGEPPSTGGVPD